MNLARTSHNRSSLLSWLDVRTLPLDDLLHIFQEFHHAWIERYTHPEKYRERASRALKLLKAMCSYIGASDDLLYQIDQADNWTAPDVIDDMALFIVIVNVLDSTMAMVGRPRFFLIDSENLRYFEKPRELFGTLTIEKFHQIAADIDEAGKCRATGRYTAAVFHLMRVMEVGLRALARSLNDSRLDAKRNPSWDAILSKCDDELKKHIQDRAPEWREDDAFYSAVTANMHAVKNAWRNPTMHVERNYDFIELDEVWNAVRAFMRHLSQKLSA